MLYLIGLGLADETDVTVKGLELIKKVERVYLEAYTSILLVDTQKLASSYSHWISQRHRPEAEFNRSRKLTMAVPLLLRTVRWLNLPVTRY